MRTLSALADPTRQQIVELLSRGDRDAGTIAAEFPISRPAISRHLRVLREAGVIVSSADGQRRVYRLRPEALDEIGSWVAKYRSFWNLRLNKLEEHLAAGDRDRGRQQ